MYGQQGRAGSVLLDASHLSGTIGHDMYIRTAPTYLVHARPLVSIVNFSVVVFRTIPNVYYASLTG